MMVRILVRVVSWSVLAYLVLPLVVILGSSLTASSFLAFPPQGLTLNWYRGMLADPSYVAAFSTSTALALAATLAALVLTVPAALALARYAFPGKRAIAALLMSPLVLPHVVLGAALLQFGGYFGLTRSFLSLLIGHCVIVAPFVLRSTLALMTPEQKALEEASADLGANPWTTFFLVVLPQIRPGIVTGSIFAFISSWINVELSIFNTTAALNTIPVKLFNYVQYTIDPTIAAVSGTTIVVAIVAITILDLTVGLDMLSDRK
ncbi:binding-protein-dependent transporter inner membrane component family protein 54 [Cupriavidus basilensis OR16]|uniref:Binding-protein-dependent transporter inner membrane component family protein 54 n=1 Tax=Cupriavidus basilensis OR16 TaxID=1127483 RepID=H1S965_9BURK|nr:ABC transporter permease [Cupriavidus basilensis]EHP40915.1 binding-protein-dependent transporter inner membrane component family protein 54 [Cupriavidus basilensis OR16]